MVDVSRFCGEIGGRSREASARRDGEEQGEVLCVVDGGRLVLDSVAAAVST